MKKRFLSAVLALAMMLTLLPVSVFAAGYADPAVADLDGDGTETVKFVSSRDKDHDAVGWYVTHSYEVTENGKTTNKSKDVYLTNDPEGVSLGGKYYKIANLDAALETVDGKTVNKSIYSKDKDGNKTGLKSGTLIVIGGTNVPIDAINATSLTLDVYGGTATISASGNKLTSVTVKNSSYATQGKGTVKLDSGLLSTLSSVDLSHVTWGDTTCTLDWTNATSHAGVKHTVKLTDVDAKSVAITLEGVGTDTKETEAAQEVNLTNSSVKSIAVTGNGSKVTLNQVLAAVKPTVSITGTGGSFSFTGGGEIGTLTVTGSATGDNGKDLTTAPAGISIAAGCTVASINASGVSGEFAAGRNTVSISGNVTGDTILRNAAVTVSGGNIAALTVETGTVKVSGSNATVGTVTLAHDATFSIEGKEHTIGDLKVDGTKKNAATVTFTVPAEATNTFGTSSASVTGYNKATISGGTWKKAVPAANLAEAVKYQLENSGSFTYYTTDQLGEAVLKQGATGGTLTMKDYPADGKSDNKVTFKNGGLTWGELTVPATGAQIPKLPTLMNDIATPYWTDKTFSNLSGLYNTVAGQETELNAGGGGAVTGEVTKLTDVEVSGTSADITARLVGNVITLSGAVKAGETTFDLILETDAVMDELDSDGKATGKDTPVTIKVSVIRNGKSLTFVNTGSQDLGYGVIMENDFQTIKLGNGTKYTLNGQGLNVPSLGIGVSTETHPDDTSTYPSDADKLYIENAIEVVVSDSKYKGTPTLQKIVIDVINGSDAAVDWTKSPAVRRAINAVLATFSDSDVEGFIRSARQRAWSDNGIKGQSFNASTTTTGYDSAVVWLAPYLEVNVTDYKPSTSGTGAANNGTLTATLTLKWRVEVHPSDTSEALVNDANNLAKNNVYIAKSGTLSFSGDLGGGVDITFDSGVAGATYAHQSGTYDYKIDDTTGTFTVTHAGTSGNLGAFVLDAKDPMIQLYTKGGKTLADGAEPDKYFSSLQAAVDASEDEDHIVVDSNYGGSLNINMTGVARTIYVQANGKNVVVANASGGLVENNKSGSLYTIKLNRDTAAPGQNIVVASATGGIANVSANPATAGQTVTITLTPATGYVSNGVTVRTSAGANVSVSGSGNTYTFVMPAGAVTVTPSFRVTDNKVTISVSPTSSGSATVYTGSTDGKVDQGGTAIITVTPNSGYRTMDVTLRADNGRTVSSTRQSENVWNITVPSGATTVTVTPSFDRDNKTPFVDVKYADWASPYISWFYNNDYTSGKDSKYTFKPTDNVTRQELVAFLWKANGSVKMTNYANPFTDVYASDWAYDAILWAAANGLVDTSSRTFGKTVNATRAEVVTVLYKYAGSQPVSNQNGFVDVAANASYAKAVTWAELTGVTNGKDNRNTFKPNDLITRQEVAKMIYVAET